MRTRKTICASKSAYRKVAPAAISDQSPLLNDMLKILTPALVLILIAFTAAYLWMNPAPPRQIRIASGQPEFLIGVEFRQRLPDIFG